MKEAGFLRWDSWPQCSLCEEGRPITFVASPAGGTSLCMSCSMRVLQMTAEEFEKMHRPYADHLGEAFQRAREREEAWSMAATKEAGLG